MLGNVTIEGLSLKEMSDAVSAALRRAGSPTTTSDHIGIGEMAVDAPLAAVLQPHVTPEIRLEDYEYFLGFTRREPPSRG